MKRYGKQMALTLCMEAKVPTDRPLGLSDIKPFEDLLDVNIMVLSSKTGNRFCRVANNPGRRNIYLYMTEPEEGVGHFDGIGSINGFFGYGYFCETCLKPYKNKGTHWCQTTCNVCCSDQCISGIERRCRYCHRICRSFECYQRYANRTDKRGRESEKSSCEKTYQCRNCRKIQEKSKRKPEDHRCGEWKCKNCFEYQLDQHLCYQYKPVTKAKKTPRKLFFYDFETTQNERMSCDEGYQATGQPCEKCTADSSRCNKCRICSNCRQSWCGLEEHKVNYAVLQSTCVKCMEEPLTQDSKCAICGSRCARCRVVKKNAVVPPCNDGCGFRQRVFRSRDAVVQFCDHIMNSSLQ